MNIVLVRGFEPAPHVLIGQAREAQGARGRTDRRTDCARLTLRFHRWRRRRAETQSSLHISCQPLCTRRKFRVARSPRVFFFLTRRCGEVFRETSGRFDAFFFFLKKKKVCIVVRNSRFVFERTWVSFTWKMALSNVFLKKKICAVLF